MEPNHILFARHPMQQSKVHIAPKVTKSHLDALKEYFVFATTFAQTGDPAMLVEYKDHSRAAAKEQAFG
ncbi:predicted protein [Lichtheimia corymbifera JMRC:FSU:9682]|uniref:Uncharacterized protein n=1 Tax=Lichtheimia corymbifera JMRC:FSU:9682 TaxID=1263082 RepID=A0A068RQV1_9FUNG|nr:predicted protein [Lichtheimia corymbifera JMRC:FSU:9682]